MKTEIPSISGLATTSALTALENKVPSVSNLIQKTDYDTKVNKIEKKRTDHNHDKYITTPEFNKPTKENFTATLAQADLVTKTDFDNKLSSLNQIIISNNTKHLVVENELKKLKTFDLSYFNGKNNFEGDDGTQNWLVFQPIPRYFKITSNNPSIILSWKSKGLSDEIIKTTTPNKILNPSLDIVGTKARVRFSGNCLHYI